MSLQKQMVEYRAKNDLTLDELATKIGLSKQTVWAIENGKKPSRVTEAKIRLVIGEENENINISAENLQGMS